MAAPLGKRKRFNFFTTSVNTPIWFFMILMLLFGCIYFSILMHMNEHTYDHHHPTTEHIQLQQMRRRSSTRKRESLLNDEANVPIPTHKDGTELNLEERVRYLELKTNAHFNFGSHPFFGSKIAQGKCKKQTDLRELGCIAGVENYRPEYPSTDGRNCPGLFDHNVCHDYLPEPNTNKLNNCLVYDFGIRAQPQFGQTMAKAFGCEVHAFDPSPVSIEWWEGGKNGGISAELHALENYHFHPYGAGGFDGDLQLNEYDWGQVSIVKYPNFKVDCTNSTGSSCKVINESYKQKTFTLPVKTLSTIMKELGHEGRTIDVLKLDVEGSEFQFLENIFDHTGGCPDFINQITLEWHHMPWDPRYGEGSSPSINTIVTLLHTCGLNMFWQYSAGGWPSNQKIFVDMDMKDVRYNLASFIREH